MPPEKKKNILWIALSGIGFSGLTWLFTLVFNTGGFVKQTKAANITLEQHISEDKSKENLNSSFQTNTLIKLESLTVTMNLLIKELERKNNIEEKYHSQHDINKN